MNDRETAALLFEKSARHSSKPDSVFADELYEKLKLSSNFLSLVVVFSRLTLISRCGYKASIPRQDHDQNLRTHRRALTRVIGTTSTAARFDHQLEEEFRRLMWKILHKPDELFDHCRKSV